MSEWKTVGVHPFELVKDFAKNADPVLKVLRDAEAIIQGILDLVSAYGIIAVSPILAPLVLLRTAIKDIIKSLSGSGISLLLVYPDISRKDPIQILNSVKGGLPGFENVISQKMYDYGDVCRPQFIAGSSAYWLVMYINAQSGADLYKQLQALLKLFGNKFKLPTPTVTEVKVLPVLQADSAPALAKLAATSLWKYATDNETIYVPTCLEDLLLSKVENKLVVEWSLQTAVSGTTTPGFYNPLMEFVGSFVSPFSDFIIERTEISGGEPVKYKLINGTSGGAGETQAVEDGLLASPNEIIVTEPSGDTFYHYSKKIYANLDTDIVLGMFGNAYRWVDTSVEPNKDYYYRIRIGTGKLSDYTSYLGVSNKEGYNSLINSNENLPVIDLKSMGPASTTVRGRVPNMGFDIITVATLTVKAAIYLDFELSPAGLTDSPELVKAKVGFGAFSAIASQIGLVKSFYGNTMALKDAGLFTVLVNRIINSSVAALYDQPNAFSMVQKEWEENGLNEIVSEIIKVAEKDPYHIVYDQGIVYPWTNTGAKLVDEYLLKQYNGSTDPNNGYSGPIPLSKFGISDRTSLRNFLGILMVQGGTSSSYLHWYSVSLGDLFPAFYPILRQIERLIESILQAAEKAIKQIKRIITNILQKIQQLEILVLEIQKLIRAFAIEFQFSILAGSQSDSSPDRVLSSIRSAQNKPDTLASSYYSGLVGIAAGPGENFSDAIRTIASLIGVEFDYK